MIYQTPQQKHKMKIQMKRQLRIRLKIAIALTLILVFVFNATACAGIKQYLWPEPTTAGPQAPTSDITVVPGWSIYQIAKALEEGNVCSAESFLKAANNIPAGYDTLLDGLGDTRGYVFAAEGYILPNTYNMYQDRDGEYAIRYFLSESQKKLNEISNDEGQTAFARAEELGMNMHEIFTLASIIQYEANLGSSDEDKKTMQDVSSVFTNRLNSPWNYPYIGSDATRKYIQLKLGDYFVEQGIYKLNENSTGDNDKYIVLDQETYDAYFDLYCTNDEYDHHIKGLPIGPVGAPSISAIKAALWPSSTSNYYFFTDKDNHYHFYTNINDFQTDWETKYKH